MAQIGDAAKQDTFWIDDEGSNDGHDIGSHNCSKDDRKSDVEAHIN
jgi:hypothetical protein